jgi:hypothetical protein
MASIEINLLAFATAANINGESRDEILSFFKTHKLCSKSQAESALNESVRLSEKLSNERAGVLTTFSIVLHAARHLQELERQRHREDEEWWGSTSFSNRQTRLEDSPVIAPENRRTGPGADGDSSNSSNPSTHQSSSSSFNVPSVQSYEEAELVKLATFESELQRGEFLVRSKGTFPSDDPQRVHDLRVGQVFVVDQVRYLDDGSNDAWFCGYHVDDPKRVQRWIFSSHVTRRIYD